MSKDRQAEQAAKVQVAVVLCRNRNHVPGLENFPTKKIPGDRNEKHGLETLTLGGRNGR